MNRARAPILLALAALIAWAPAAAQSDGVVRVVLFSASYCAACRGVKSEVLPVLRERFGDRLEVHELDIDDPDNHRRLIDLEERWDVPPEARVIPTAVVGDDLLAGADAIREELPGLIEAHAGRGGTAWPTLDVGEAPAARADAEAEHAARHERRPVWALFFEQPGCRECSRARADLEWVRERHPEVIVEERNIYEHADLAWWLGERNGVSRVVTPALFIGDEALVGPEQLTARAIEALVERHGETGAPPPWIGFEATEGRSGLVRRFREMGPLAVIAAGLVDGINPCAFATIIFFVSYLTISGRKGRQILAVGAAFTVGVFIAYLALGLGLHRALDLLGGTLTIVGRWVLGVTAVLCAALAVLSFRDYTRARAGKLEEMSLTLPKGLRDRIHRVIRRGRGAQAIVATSFFTGIAVSLLELACTGQVYLPTIIFVTSVPELRAQAVAYLVLYNVLFVVPLIVVFVLVYFGTTQKQLIAFLKKRAAAVKLAMTALFASLAIWLALSIPAL